MEEAIIQILLRMMKLVDIKLIPMLEKMMKMLKTYLFIII